MERLPCSVRFRVIEPLDEYRVDCPYILITSSGPHTHSIPFPSKTPPVIRAKVFELLEALGDDIPDILAPSNCEVIPYGQVPSQSPTDTQPLAHFFGESLQNQNLYQVDQGDSLSFRNDLER